MPETFKVLLVDDDEDAFVLTNDLLSDVTDPLYVLDWVSSFEEAEETLRRREHDVYLIDHWLGAHTGLELLAKVNAETSSAPFIVLTGQNSHNVDVEAMKAGASDYLVKGEITGSMLERSVRYSIERKRVEVELARRTEALERSNRELQQFAYVASHDLQEPLRMVASYTKLLEQRYRGKLDADADEFIHFAVDGATRMQKLIEDLLAYSRVETRGTAHEPIDCGKAMEEALVNLSMVIEERDAHITYENLPYIEADRGQIVQLFQNLVGNAVKFVKDRRPEVRVCAVQLDGEWRFSVSDNGIGIDPRYADRIFEIFQRLHGRNEFPGTGMGLAISKKIVERHGGRIWVESEPNAGTVFHFTVPTRQANAA